MKYLSLVLLIGITGPLYAQAINELEYASQRYMSWYTQMAADLRWYPLSHWRMERYLAWGDSRFDQVRCQEGYGRFFDGGSAVVFMDCEPFSLAWLPFNGERDDVQQWRIISLMERWLKPVLEFTDKEVTRFEWRSVHHTEAVEGGYTKCYGFTIDNDTVCSKPGDRFATPFPDLLDFLFIFPDSGPPLVGDFTDNIEGALVALADYYERGLVGGKLNTLDGDLNIPMGEPLPDPVKHRSWGQVKRKGHK